MALQRAVKNLSLQIQRHATLAPLVGHQISCKILSDLCTRITHAIWSRMAPRWVKVDHFEYQEAVEIFLLPLPALGLLSLSTRDESRFKTCRNLNMLSNIMKIRVVLSWVDHGSFDKIVDVSARLRFSQQDLGYLAKILDGWARSRVFQQDLERLDEIADISARSLTSQQGLGCLGKIAARSSISRCEARNLGEISARSHLSCQDHFYLGEITEISARSQQNFYLGKDLLKVSARARSGAKHSN